MVLIYTIAEISLSIVPLVFFFPPPPQPFCVNINNCQIFECQYNCNAGTCTPLGICKCQKDHYGLDCSVSIKNNCIQSGPSPLQRACWEADIPDCHTLNFKVTTYMGDVISRNIKVDETTTLDLVPCNDFYSNLTQNVKCEMCIPVTDLKVVGADLIGCPTVKITCSDIEVSNYQIDCLSLVNSPKLVCPNAPVAPGQADTGIFASGGTGKTILLVLASILGLLFIAGLGYYTITKYFGFEIPNVFQPVDVYTEDVEPLKDGIQVVDEDVEE